MDNKERLEKIKEVHLERIKQNELYTASFIHVDWLIEQAEKVERYENAIQKAMINTYDDDTNEFLRRVLQNKENDAPNYRLK